jgi:hypothetical protein
MSIETEKKPEGELISDAEAVHNGNPATSLSSAVELVAQSLARDHVSDTVTASLDRIADAIAGSGLPSASYELADRWGQTGLNNIARAIHDGLNEIADAIRESKVEVDK